MEGLKRPALAWIFAIGCVAFFCVQASRSVIDKSPTNDEPRHLLRGYAYLFAPDLRLNLQHPPVFNVLAAAPIADHLHPALKLSNDNPLWQTAQTDEIANEFYAVIAKQKITLWRARLMIIAIGAILGLALFALAKKYFGRQVAMTAVFLFALSPTLTAHASLVTTDAGITLSLFLAFWALLRFVRRRDFFHFFILVGAVDLALVSKFSGVLFIPFAVLFLLAYDACAKVAVWRPAYLRRALLGLAIFGVISFTAIGVLYRFEALTLAQAARNPEMKERLLDYAAGQRPPFNHAALWAVENLKLPGAYYYLGFFDNVISHNESGHSTYLLGKTSTVGWWYYFLIALAVKSTLPVLFGSVIFLAGCATWVYKKIQSGVTLKNIFRDHPETVGVTLFPLFYLLAFLPSRVNLGIRYLLPIYPFLFLWTALVVRWLLRQKKIWLNTLLAIIAVAAIAENILTFPHYLEYFNPLAGGSTNGYRYLLDSNLSWGQNTNYVLSYLKAYQEKNPNAPTVLNPGCRPQNGLMIVDVNAYLGLYDNTDDSYDWLRENYTPIDMIAYTHWVFEVTGVESINPAYFEQCQKIISAAANE